MRKSTSKGKILLSALGFTLLLSPSAWCATTDPIPADVKTGWENVKQDVIRRDLTYLTSDQMAGRLAATPGDEKATQWLVEQFKQAGLKPGNGSSYLQTFNVIQYHADSENTALTIQHPDQSITLKKPDIFTDFPLNVELSGYGITAPGLNYDDYQNIDVKGKFVLVFEHEPQELDATSIFNGTGNTPYATARIKALNAQQHGAIGVLIAPEPNRKHPSNAERRARIGGSTARKKNSLPEMVLESDELQIPVVVLSDKAAKKVAGSLALEALQAAIDKDLQPRSQIITDTAVTLKERMKDRKIKTTSNVVGLLEGSDESWKDQTIMVSAHHDHDGSLGKQIWHGADDNGSGTIGVVAVARAMAANSGAHGGLRPRRSILFTVFAAEERGLLGAYYMASRPLRSLDTTYAMINFDMIGRDEKPSKQTDGLIDIPKDTHNRLNLIGAHFSPGYDRVVKEQNKYVGLTLDDRFDSEHALNVFFRSDQFPFVLNEVPAFWWFTGFHPDYHQTTDTADKIDYPKMQKIIRLAYLSAYQFANTDTPPKFILHPKPGA
jgi:hypothetical protein